MVLSNSNSRLDGGGNPCYTHRKKKAMNLKKWLTILLVLCLGTGCVLFSLAWRKAEQQTAEWKARAEMAELRAAQAEASMEISESQRRLLSLENDPIAVFFAPFPYSGGTARYLAVLEAEAYRAELQNAAALLQGGTDNALIDGFLSFIDTQAYLEADAWTASLSAQDAGTAGAWAHVNQCQIPIYQFGAYTLISTYQRTGKTYSFLFDPEATKQLLLLAGFREEDLPEPVN